MAAKIQKENLGGILDWMLDGEQVAVVDMGFRNALDDFEVLGNLETKIPSLTPKGKAQNNANSSRLVTKVRWVVEAYHGRFKKFKFFDNLQRSQTLKK